MAKSPVDPAKLNPRLAKIVKRIRALVQRDIRKKYQDPEYRRKRLADCAKQYLALAKEFVALAELLMTNAMKIK
jgi:HEPN domain-containing protein